MSEEHEIEVRFLSLPQQQCFCGNSSVGRASPCQGEGRGSESRFPLKICYTGAMDIFAPLNSLEKTSLFQSVYRWILPRARKILPLFLLYEFLVFGPVVGAIYLNAVGSEYLGMADLGRTFGQIAVVWYVLSLVPGMMKRLNLLPMTRTLLMLYRRHFGISMFLTAISHQFLARTLPLAFFNPALLLDFDLGWQAWFGVLALLTLFPLWLTSNDWSKKRLGRTWDAIHMLTYLALLFIFGHVYLVMTSSWKYVLGAVIVLEIISWLVYWLTPRVFAPKTPAATAPASPVQ